MQRGCCPITPTPAASFITTCKRPYHLGALPLTPRKWGYTPVTPIGGAAAPRHRFFLFIIFKCLPRYLICETFITMFLLTPFLNNISTLPKTFVKMLFSTYARRLFSEFNSKTGVRVRLALKTFFLLKMLFNALVRNFEFSHSLSKSSNVKPQNCRISVEARALKQVECIIP